LSIHPTLEQASKILASYGLQGSHVERFGTGLINDTFLVTVDEKQRFVLQKLNALFAPEINLDIDTLTRHLALNGRPTPRLLPADNGRLWVEEGENIWRLSIFVPGICLDMLHTDTQAAEAGALLAEFHKALRTIDMELHTERLGVHDTKRHLSALTEALGEYPDHRNFETINVIAQDILSEAARMPILPTLPDRLVHGDPKISNLIFDEQSGAGVCMIDLDTLAHMPLPLELGDAFRSWCNPRGENVARSEFRMDFFASAVNGYAEVAKSFILPIEWQNFVAATRIIMVELAARFATDALRENYFGWDPENFADRSAHNQVRAAGQLELHRSLLSQVDEADNIVQAAFGEN